MNNLITILLQYSEHELFDRDIWSYLGYFLIAGAIFVGIYIFGMLIIIKRYLNPKNRKGKTIKEILKNIFWPPSF
ncbi:MAG: hypothetical protein FWD60_09340 [Candidatus Azobacteroides sp.]|nr:hypothetical protein [Candidatus Azobacteroides sp.]